MPDPSNESQSTESGSRELADGLWHARPVGAVLASLGTDGARGLADVEARRRFERDGPNELDAEPPVPAWRRFLAQFQSVLVLLLIAATAISLALWFLERDAALPYDAIAIIAIVCSTRRWASYRRRARNRRSPRCGRCPPPRRR